MSAGLKSSAANRDQGGAVLIMALMIVSVVAGLAVKFTGDYQLGLAKAESRWHGAQARSYLAGAENLATFLLEQDLDPEVDHLMEPWAQEAPPFQIDGGWILASVEDAQSRLNLNDLGDPLDPDKALTDPTRYSEMQRRFIRLLQTFEEEDVPLNEDEAVVILEALVDWMDRDNEPSGFGGAEADYYRGLDPEYLPANDAFVSVEELRLVRHVGPQLMELLRPYLVVLPPGQNMNVNTLSLKMLRTINASSRLQPLGPMEVELLRQDWPEDGYHPDVQNFLSSPAWQGIGGEPPETSGLSVKSNYFMVNTTVSLVDQRRSMRSLMRRTGDDKFEVVRRADVY